MSDWLDASHRSCLAIPMVWRQVTDSLGEYLRFYIAWKMVEGCMSTVVGNTLPLAKLKQYAGTPELARQSAVALVLSLHDSDDEVRAWAAEVLENMGAPTMDCTAQLAELTRHVIAPVAAWACKLIGRLGEEGTRFQDILAAAVEKHVDVLVKQEAVAALAKLGNLSPSTRDILRRAAIHENPRLKRMALAALAD